MRKRKDVRELFGTVEIDPDYDYKALRRNDGSDVSMTALIKLP
jgi:hypothetical protein